MHARSRRNHAAASEAPSPSADGLAPRPYAPPGRSPRRTAASLGLALGLLLAAGAPGAAGAATATAVLGSCAACPYRQCSLCGVAIKPPPVELQLCGTQTRTVSGRLAGAVMRPNVCGLASRTGNATTDVLWNTYGALVSTAFVVSGTVTYRYDVPFTLAFETSTCGSPGQPVRISDPHLTWGTPTLTADQHLDFATQLHSYVDIPLDTLGPFVLDAAVFKDHLAVSGVIPDPIPGWTPTFGFTRSGPPFDDGRFCVPGTSACLTLGGEAPPLPSAGTSTLYASALMDSGRIEILFGNPWTSASDVWWGAVDQITVFSWLVPQPGGGVLAALDPFFHLVTELDLGIARRDRAFVSRVQVPTSAGTLDAATPAGDATATFSVPISYDLELKSGFYLPASFRVLFDAPHFDPEEIIGGSLGDLPVTSSDAVAWLLSLAPFNLQCTTGASLTSHTAAVEVTVPLTVKTVAEPPADSDGDGIVDDADNCPGVPNPGQENLDSDAMGDTCDPDLDNDGTPNEQDSCPTTSNVVVREDGTTWLDVADSDGDGIGDVCDADRDGDGIDNARDNCPADPNPDQTNSDATLAGVAPDAEGDACDPDDDNDLVPDVADDCPFVPNPTQADLDGDGTGDACDADADGDGIPELAADGARRDNCPLVANADQADYDGDGLGNACDPDLDGDGVRNEFDACQLTPLASVVDSAGCSLAQLCPCPSPRGTTSAWGNHGKYVSCVSQAAEAFLAAGLLDAPEKDLAVSTAAQSACGARR